MAKSKALVKAEGKLKQLQKAVKDMEKRVKTLAAKDAKAAPKKKGAKKKVTSKKKVTGKKKTGAKKKAAPKKKGTAKKSRAKKVVKTLPMSAMMSDSN